MNPNPNPNKALWEKGDFTRIAASMRESGEDVAKEMVRTAAGTIWLHPEV